MQSSNQFPQEPEEPQEDLNRQGLVYPPPPSFYQHVQVPSPPPMPGGSPIYPGMEGAGLQPPQSIHYSGMQPPPFAPIPLNQSQGKKSHKWLWITISIAGVLLLAACGVCGWAFSQFITPLVQSETDAINVTNEYYAALQNKDYTGAYQCLMPQGPIQGITQTAFMQRAQSTDNQYGIVRSYTIGAANIVMTSNNAFNFSRLMVVMNITRTGKSYNVSLTVVKSGNNWKVTDFDRL